ncbi:MAG: hypothetical protein HKN12_11480 [Gemmatimonadetes bacterium]|nr:hypothetical protein [Gemmatimonadota bacterium]
MTWKSILTAASMASAPVVSALLAAAFFVPAPPAHAEDIPAELRDAVADLLPDGHGGAREGSAGGESWNVALGEMNAAAPAEAIVVLMRPERPVEIRFLGAKASGDVVKKKVKLDRPTASASVSFEMFREGHTLAHVDGSEGGQVLLSWNGEKLDTVWKKGPGKGGARHWFETEDLDGDGVREVVTYMQRELDVFLDEDDLEDSSAGVGNAAVDAVSVLRWHDGRWKESKELRAGLHSSP